MEKQTKLGKVTANRHFAHLATSNVNACAFLHDQDPKQTVLVRSKSWECYSCQAS